jgi:hypothetical protein
MNPKKYIMDISNFMRANESMRIATIFHEFMLTEGKEFREHLTLDYKKDKRILKWLSRNPQKQACYYNSQLLAVDNPELKYFEGFATTKKLGLPLEHGWCVFEGKVVDVTWKDNGDEYFGVEVPVGFIRKRMVETQMSRDLLRDYFMNVKGIK